MRSNPALHKADTEWKNAIQSPLPTPICGQKRSASSAAPTSSTTRTVLKMNPVRRTMPASCGAEMDSCITQRRRKPIFCPASTATATAMLMTPRPPACMSMRMTACPNSDQ